MSENQLQNIKNQIKPILKESGIPFAGIFGSCSRGEEKQASDIDILIRTPSDRRFSFVDLIHVEEKLKKILNRKVDLVTEGGVSKYMKKYILNDLQIIYGQK